MSAISDILKEITSLAKDIVTTQVKFEGLDREVHRLCEAMKSAFERHEDVVASKTEKVESGLDSLARQLSQENQELKDRLGKLEADFHSAYREVVLNNIAEKELKKFSAAPPPGETSERQQLPPDGG